MFPKRGKKYSFIKKGFRNNRWGSELTDHQFSPSTKGTDNKIRLALSSLGEKCSKEKKLDQRFTQTTNYAVVLSCRPKFKKESVPIISSHLRRPWRYLLTQTLSCCLWICFGFLATLNVFRYIPVSYPISLIPSLDF